MDTGPMHQIPEANGLRARVGGADQDQADPSWSGPGADQATRTTTRQGASGPRWSPARGGGASEGRAAGGVGAAWKRSRPSRRHNPPRAASLASTRRGQSRGPGPTGQAGALTESSLAEAQRARPMCSRGCGLRCRAGPARKGGSPPPLPLLSLALARDAPTPARTSRFPARGEGPIDGSPPSPPHPPLEGLPASNSPQDRFNRAWRHCWSSYPPKTSWRGSPWTEDVETGGCEPLKMGRVQGRGCGLGGAERDGSWKLAGACGDRPLRGLLSTFRDVSLSPGGIEPPVATTPGWLPRPGGSVLQGG